MKNRIVLPLALSLVIGLTSGSAQRRRAREPVITEKTVYSIENEKVRCRVSVAAGSLVTDRLEAKPDGGGSGGTAAVQAIETDGDFALDLLYTDWDAPGKANCAENLITLTKGQFRLIRAGTHDGPRGAKDMELLFRGDEHSIRLLMTYRLENGAFYVKRSIAVQDSTERHHFLRWIWPRAGAVSGVSRIVKEGGFGQPAAFLLGRGGGFFGYEYPASDNHLEKTPQGGCRVRCGGEMGERISKEWLSSDWVVEGVTPDEYVKKWFFSYLDDIRVAPLRPFSLYNTWYDLRSPEYPKWPAEKAMSEKTAMTMVGILRKNMIEKHHIQLDAFVLDDGWDVYKSGWELRKEQWPNGLRPLAEELKKTNTALGIWFGPTGGYSFHNQRVNWMKEHGYEVVSGGMCVAGKNYSALLKKRVTDFVQNDGVGYFKWDGIQFSCSEPDHGHPIDVYSRRAVLNTVGAMSGAVREKDPAMFLNISSGTWMSPWWVRYANTIWMQGGDYGFAEVPSISMRDGAITYRDFVLYEDWKLKGLWFPIANLMTHGIIKGKEESVGTTLEPLDKFTDDALFYFARGVAMYELYISPDILSDGEWTSISRSMAWARDRFPVLMNTEMVGGNPMKGEAYGYVHFKGSRGIISARNPVIEPAKLRVALSTAEGLDPGSSSLVLERVYPTRWVSPKLYKANDELAVPLDGYEAAVYELYPLKEASWPLLAGICFAAEPGTDGSMDLSVFGPTGDVAVLNPALIRDPAGLTGALKTVCSRLLKEGTAPVLTGVSVRGASAGRSSLEISCTVSGTSSDGMLAIMTVPEGTSGEKIALKASARIDGSDAEVKTEYQEGRSEWYKIGLAPGKHTVTVSFRTAKDSTVWRGKATAWFISRQKQNTGHMSVSLAGSLTERPMPPVVWPAGELRKNLRLGTAALVVTHQPL
jgi:hypothetical protein